MDVCVASFCQKQMSQYLSLIFLEEEVNSTSYFYIWLYFPTYLQNQILFGLEIL